MHHYPPGMIHWWKTMRDRYERAAECRTGCGGESQHGRESRPEMWASEWDGGAFGVRRPLRFLAHKLELDERQTTELARILNELKTERAQAEVDGRRTLAAFADALSADAFDKSKATDAGKLRVDTAERLKSAVLRALEQIHGILSPEQRGKLAYLIRTGTLTL